MYQINKRQNQLHLRPRFFVGRLEPVCLCTRGPLASVQRAGVSVRLRVSIFYVAAISERPGGIIFRGDRRLYASSRPPPSPPFPLSPLLATAAVPATARLCHIGRHAPIEKTQRNAQKKNCSGNTARIYEERRPEPHENKKYKWQRGRRQR